MAESAITAAAFNHFEVRCMSAPVSFSLLKYAGFTGKSLSSTGILLLRRRSKDLNERNSSGRHIQKGVWALSENVTQNL